jgi:hypothetical protein
MYPACTQKTRTVRYEKSVRRDSGARAQVGCAPANHEATSAFRMVGRGAAGLRPAQPSWRMPFVSSGPFDSCYW